MKSAFPTLRLRRLRQHPVLRELVRETELHVADLVQPLFIKGESGELQPIASMPGQSQIPLSQIEREVEQLVTLGIKSVILFGVPPHKDPAGSNSTSETGIVQQAIRKIGAAFPDLLIISDVCLCEYTDHGHCGILSEKRGKLDLDNDKTLAILAEQAVSHAAAGANVVAPSGMVDGMVHAIRVALDQNGFEHIPILSYAVKYNSAFYGPFRLAAEGGAKFGDRSSHQMDPANGREALRETHLDVLEGADMLMVKPAHTYLDVIARVKQAHPNVPLAAYHTSGEYALLKAASEKGWIDERTAVTEVLRSIRRAGADFILTYYASAFARWSKERK
jgi:porphobilinogen synthase